MRVSPPSAVIRARVRVEEAPELLGRGDQEVAALEGGVGSEGSPRRSVRLASIDRPPYGWYSRSVPIRSRRNIEWWRSKIHSPARWPSARVPSSCLELVERGVVRQVEEDHVVEVPAVGHVVPAEEPDPELLLVLLHLPGEDRPHEELEERIAAATDREVGREHGHGRRSSSSGHRSAAIVARGPRPASRARRPRRASRAANPRAGRRSASGPPAAGAGRAGRRPRAGAGR